MHSVLEALRRLPDLGDPYEDERRALAAIATDIPAASVRDAARTRALRYIDAVRAADTALLSAQNLLNSFPLATPEGIALLRLAEALVARSGRRNTDMADRREACPLSRHAHRDGWQLRHARARNRAEDCRPHCSRRRATGCRQPIAGSLRAWLAKSALRPLVIDGIRRFGDQFVFATNLPDAMARVRRRPDSRVTYSFDMLGEGARTRADADRSYTSYVDALESLKSALTQRRQGLDGARWHIGQAVCDPSALRDCTN